LELLFELGTYGRPNSKVIPFTRNENSFDGKPPSSRLFWPAWIVSVVRMPTFAPKFSPTAPTRP
jgi:hypothetical protein